MSRFSLERISSLRRKYGTWGFIKRALVVTSNFIFSYRPLVIFAIKGVPENPAKPSCLIEIRKGGPRDTDLIINAISNEMDPAFVREYMQYHFQSGGELFLAFSSGKLAHYCWMFFYPGFKEQLAYIHLKSDEAHIATAHTTPEFRGKNIYPVVLQHLLNYAKTKGINTIYITSLLKNTASVRGIEKAGFSKFGTIHGIKIDEMTEYWPIPPGPRTRVNIIV